MSGAAGGGARSGGSLRSTESLWDPTGTAAISAVNDEASSGDPSASILLVDDGAATTNVTLVAGAPTRRLVGGMTLPRGGSPEAVRELLAIADRESSRATPARGPAIIRGGSAELPRAAFRIATALGLPVALVDIGATSGRYASAAPGQLGAAIDLAAAALSPRQAIERRRRADVVIASIQATSRAMVADQLGDLCDAPLRDRSPHADRIRTAAAVGALSRLGEELRAVDIAIEQGSLVVVTGFAARNIADGRMPLASLAPLLPIGRSRILLDPFATAGPLGSAEFGDGQAVEFIRDRCGELFHPGGDLLCIEEGEIVVSVDGRSAPLGVGEVLSVPVAMGEVVHAEIRRGDAIAEAHLSGGVGGAAIVVGVPTIAVALNPAPSETAMPSPYPAQIGLIAPLPGGRDLIPGRRLLGDSVSGRVVALMGDPDSRGWEAAREAGILAVAKASPETVLRARAVGVRGLIVGSLSDGEIEALSGSLERRIAAAVATLPFGLLVLAARSASSEGAAPLISQLDGADVGLSADPPGLVVRGTMVRDAGQGPRGADVAIVGGPYAGRRGYWRGLADPRPGDPIAAIEVEGAIIGLPLGEVQRLDA